MLLEIVLLVLAVPVGFLIAWLARDELVVGRKYFRALIIASILLGIWFWLTGFTASAWAMGFVLIVSVVSFVKSG